MRVLVTGAGGFTGHHLLENLRERGCETAALGIEEATGNHERALAAALDETDRITDWLRAVRPTHIIHLAALSNVVGEALPFYAVNVLGTESLLTAIDRAGLSPECVVIASSANIYGNVEGAPIVEENPPRPLNHYALSKAAMELMLIKWRTLLPITVTRPFNYTGPGQATRFVYAKIAECFRRRDPILTLGNIDVARDLSDVRDVADIYARLLTAPPGQTVNICSGRAVSLADAIDIFAAATGHRAELRTDPAFVRTDEIKGLVGDPTRLEELIGPIQRRPVADTFAAMLGD
jgi:nucleoside-diphosphate-sugar epimerase